VPDPEIDANTVMRNCIELDPEQNILEGALIYKIQRKLYAESDEFVQDEAKNIRLLVTWHSEYTKGLDIRALLIENDKEFNWDEDKLRRLHQKYWHLFDVLADFIGSSWLLDDATVLTSAVDVMNGGYKLDIVIYEKKGVTVIERPLWIDTERWVSMVLVIFLTLTCTTSLTFHMPMDVTIHNQYLGIKLTSPVCFCDGRICNEYSVKRMNDNAVMKIGFRFSLLNKLPSGILMHEVQRNGGTGTDHQPSADTTFTETVEGISKITRLLVTWEIKHCWELRIRAVLIEHDNELVLNENKIVQLYNKVNSIHSKVYSWIFKYDGIYKSTWLMHDDTVLEVAYDVVYEKGLELNVTVTEGVKDEDAAPAF
jgi:hypothetical protein